MHLLCTYLCLYVSIEIIYVSMYLCMQAHQKPLGFLNVCLYVFIALVFCLLSMYVGMHHARNIKKQ